MNQNSNFVTKLNLNQLKLVSVSEQKFRLPELPAGRYGLHFLFDVTDYPLNQHLCYMRPRAQRALSEKSLLRFVEMDFAVEPPGIPVGPWPGWRGIPEMPSVAVSILEKKFFGRFNFWGDEFKTGQLRNIVLVEINQQGTHDTLLNFSDARLKPVSVEIYAAARPKIEPKPVSLRPELRQNFPRLLFSPNAIPDLLARKNTTHAQFWKEIKNLLANQELEFKLTPESKTLPGPERLNEQDLAVLTAFNALIEPSTAAHSQAIAAFEALLEKALTPDYEPMLIDTQSGECLFSLCVAFDWLTQKWSVPQRKKYQEKMFAVADRVWQHLGYEREDFAQAHFLGCSHGLLAFSFLFWDEHPRAQEWAAHLHGVFVAVISFFPQDGFYPHGINLWIYEHIFLLRYLELFRHCAGINFWQATDYWKNTSRFRGAALSPDGSRGITFGDPQYRVTGDAWMHYLIAARTGSEAAQALAQILANQPTEGVDFRSVTPRRRVWEFLFFNPTISEKADLAPKLFFPDGGQIFWRTKVDKKDTLVTVRAGAPLGKSRYNWGEWSGFGHNDPGNGSFLVSKGELFWACGPGPVYRRDTSLHNTVTIDGHGQIGDGMVWAPEFVPPDRFAKILKETNDPEFFDIEMDLRPVYLDFLGVKKYTRRIAFFLTGIMIIEDKIELDQPRNIEWNFHTYGEIKLMNKPKVFMFRLSKGPNTIELHLMNPVSVEWQTGLSEFVPAYPNSGERDRFLRFTKFAQSAEFLVMLDFNDTGINGK